MKKTIEQLQQKISELNQLIAEYTKVIAEQAKMIAEQAKVIAEQASEITLLKKRLGLNSQNSSLPPSSDGLKKKPLIDHFVKIAYDQLAGK